MRITHLFTLGDLTLYVVETNESRLQDPVIYWKDSKNPQGFGPFQTLNHCIEHYKHAYDAPLPDNVIKVNFNRRQRL